MACLHQAMGAGRTVSTTLVALLHAILGYMLVTGMANTIAWKTIEDLKTFDVDVPLPLQRVEVRPQAAVVRAQAPRVDIAAQPLFIPTGSVSAPKIGSARGKGDLRTRFSTDNYLRNEVQGFVRVSLGKSRWRGHHDS